MPTVEEIRIGFDNQISAGAAAATRDLEKLAQAAEKIDAPMRQVSQTGEGLVSRFDALSKATNNLANAKALAADRAAILAASLKNGDIGAAEYTRSMDGIQAPVIRAQKAMDALSGSHDAVTVSSGNAAFAMRQLGVQSVQAFSSIASGMPVITTLIQQGHQVVDVSLSTGQGFGAMAKGVGSMIASINPYVLAGTAMVAATVALGVGAESTARQLATLRNQLSATRDDYVQVAGTVTAAAKAIAASTGISTADARAAGQVIASAPNYSGSQAQLESLIKTAGDLSLMLGGTAADAAKKLAVALQDPAKAAADLANEHFPGMSQALAYSIKLQADAGDKAGAFARELAVLQVGTKHITDDGLTPLQQAIHGLSDAFTKTGQDGRSLANVLGTAITDAAAWAIEKITAVTSAIEHMRQIAVSLLSPGAIPNQVKGAVSPSTSLPTAVMTEINTIAERKNFAGNLDLSSIQADFATKIAEIESGGNQFNTAGGVLTSSAGALGRFQLMPQTAAALSVDPTTSAGNTEGGLKYIAQLWAKYNGDPALVAMAYNWGPGNVDKFIAGVSTVIPAETQGYVAKMGLSLPGGGSASGGMPVPPIPPGSVSGGPNNSAQDDAFTLVKSLGGLSFQRDQNLANQKNLQASIAAGGLDPDTLAKTQEALARLRGEESDLITDQQKMARSAVDATVALQAQAGFARDMAVIDQQFAAAERSSGIATDQKTLAIAKAAKQVALATDYSDAIHQTDLDTAAQLRVAAAYDGTAQSISHMQNQETATKLARAKFAEGTDQYTDSIETYTRSLDAASAASRNFQQAQASIADLANAFTQAFDAIGNSITQAFVQGQGAAVNWGNVMKGVATQVIQQFVKLAVINPIANSLFGGNAGTLGGALAVLTGGNAAGAGSVSAGQAAGNSGFGLGTLSNLWSLAKGGYSVLTGGLSGGSYLGMGAGVDSFFGVGAGAAGMAPVVGPGGLIAEGATTGGLASTSGFLGTGSSLGAWGGGIGAGFAAGSLLGGYLQGTMGKTGPAPTIGAGIGALGGAAIGSLFGPVGTVVGGLAGGLFGGAGGSFIGPGKQSSYTSTAIGVNGNQLNLGNSIGQQADIGGSRSAAQQQVDAFNQLVQQGNLSLNYVPVNQLGQGAAGGGKFNNLQDALSKFQFGSSDPRMNAAVQGKSFSDFQSLIDVVNKVTQLNDFVGTTMPALVKAADKPESQLVEQYKALNATYNDAIDQARQLGVAEGDLVTARDKALANLTAASDKAIGDQQFSISQRYATAAASISNSPASAQAIALANFDRQAQDQRDAWGQQLVDKYGQWFAQDSRYADQMLSLDKTLNEERLALQQQYNDKLAASASGPITSLTSYVQQLQTGSASPLSAQDQLLLATNQFNAVSGAATAGNFNSLSSLSGYANSFLSASRNVNGSGAAYVADFNKVLDVLSNISATTTDQLTASVLTAETRTQTAILVDNLQALKDEVAALRRQVAQNAGAPGQLAA